MTLTTLDRATLDMRRYTDIVGDQIDADGTTLHCVTGRGGDGETVLEVERIGDTIEISGDGDVWAMLNVAVTRKFIAALTDALEEVA